MAATDHRPAAVLARLAGGQDDIFDDVPGSRPKFTAMGGVLLSTAGMAVVSAAFAVHMALDAPVAVAVLIGLAWGLIILTLDRMLVLGMGHERSLRRNVAMALPRLALALILGTVISTPLTLQIFHKEIDSEVEVLQQQAKDEYERQLATNPDLSRIPTLTEAVAREKAVIASGGTVDPNEDPRVGSAQTAVAAAQKVYDDANKKYLDLQAQAQCELNGRCGTGTPGVGTAYREAQTAADRQLVVVNDAKRTLTAAQSRLAEAQRVAGSTAATSTKTTLSQAQQNLQRDQKTLDDLQKKKAALQASYEAKVDQDDGLLARLEALHQLGKDRPLLFWAQLLVAALFICIEILPVLMKLLLNVGRPTAYERALERRDDGDADRYDALAELRQESAIEMERRRIARQSAVAEEIDEDVVEQQRAIIREALAIWSLHAQSRARRQLDDYQRQLAADSLVPAGSPPRTGAASAGPAVQGSEVDDLWVPPTLTAPAPSGQWTAYAQAGAQSGNGHATNGHPANGQSTSTYLQAAQMPDENEIQ